MSDGDKIFSKQVLFSGMVTLKGREITTDLIIFDIPDFDVILNIDFLSQYKAKIDYRKKKDRFHLDDSKEFTFDKSCVMSIMIKSIKGRKILSKGYTSYLANIIGKLDGSNLNL